METINKNFDLTKRPKLNLVTEQEETIESMESTDIDTMVERSKGTTISGEEKHPHLTLN